MAIYECTGAKAIRNGKWKAVKNDVRKNPEKPRKRYILDTDPGEETNLVSGKPEIIFEMNAILKTAATNPSSIINIASVSGNF